MPTSAEQSTTDNKKTELNFWQKNILSILVVITVMQLGRAMITPIFALFVTEQLGGNDITIGILYAATGLMVFITAPRWGKFFDQIYHQEEYLQKVIVALLFISAILQVLHIFAASTISIFILRLLWGICLGALLPILLRLLADQASDHAHGMFLGYGDSANKIGNLLGMIIGAMISAHLGYASTFLLIASFYILSGLIFMLGMRPTLARTYS